jgi:hypothetical protein
MKVNNDCFSNFNIKKQILYLKNSYDEAERVAMKPTVNANLIENTITLIEAAKRFEMEVLPENKVTKFF